jgi:ABC-2 type transport system permease protein
VKEFFILFKYISLSKTRRIKERRFKINLGWISYIIPVIVFGLPVGLIMYRLLKTLPMPLADIFFSMFIISSSFLFILSYAPTIVFNLYGSSDVYFLLTLPIKRSSIFLFKAIDSLVYSSPAIGFIFPICIAYSVAIGMGWFIGLIAGMLFIVFLLVISFFFGALVSKVMSRTSAKILSNFIYLLSILVYVIILNVIKPDTTTQEGIRQFIINSKRYLDSALSYFSPAGWLISVIKGESIGYLLILGMSLLLGLLVYNITNTLVIESSSSRNSKRASFSKSSSSSPFFVKDLKLLFRDPQAIYMLLYSIAFPSVMLIVNKSYTGALLVMAMIASFYCSYIAVHLLVSEKKVWPFPKLLPIKLTSILIWKVLIPFLLYSFLYLILIVISISLFNLDRIILFTIPMVSLAFLYSGILAINFVLKDPKRDVSSRNVFRTSEVFIIEGVTMGIVAGIIVPFIIYITPSGLQGSFKIVIGIPVIVLLSIIYLSRRTLKSIAEAINSWE